MEELPLREAFFAGQRAAKEKGLWFAPNVQKLLNDLNGTERKAGTLIIPSGQKNYQIINIDAHNVRIPKEESESTAEELWECVKEHYGLNSMTAVMAGAGISIPKSWLGYPVIGNSSGFTNLTSHFGLKFYPLKTLKNGTKIARTARAVFGTTRVFGVLSRANAVGFIGFAIVDVIMLAACMNQK